MKQLKKAVLTMQLAIVLLVSMTSKCEAQQDTMKEKAVKAYYAGYETHDWNSVAGQLADGFTFTSPAGDDHISLEKYKEKCWVTNQFVKKVEYVKMVEKSDDLILLVQIFTTDSKVVRNIDVFTFNSTGKIKSHECFFGSGAGFPGNTK